MTIIGWPTWWLWLVTFAHVPFSPPLLLILAFQPIWSHTNVTKGHYVVCSTEEFFFKKTYLNRAVWLRCGKWHVKSHTYVSVHHVDNMFFVLLVQFALVHLKFNFVWLCQKLVSLGFLQGDYRTHQFAWNEYFFLEINVCVYPSLRFFFFFFFLYCIVFICKFYKKQAKRYYKASLNTFYIIKGCTHTHKRQCWCLCFYQCRLPGKNLTVIL